MTAKLRPVSYARAGDPTRAPTLSVLVQGDRVATFVRAAAFTRKRNSRPRGLVCGPSDSRVRPLAHRSAPSPDLRGYDSPPSATGSEAANTDGRRAFSRRRRPCRT